MNTWEDIKYDPQHPMVTVLSIRGVPKVPIKAAAGDFKKVSLNS